MTTARACRTSDLTWIPNPVVGDMYYETVYSNYKDMGGIKVPGRFHQHQDYDDGARLPNIRSDVDSQSRCGRHVLRNRVQQLQGHGRDKGSGPLPSAPGL